MNRGYLAIGLILLMTLAAPAAAINFSADAPDPYIDADTVTVASHDMQWESATMYEADDGTVTELPATVNESADNPYSVIASDINYTDAGAFPHSKDDVSALDAGEWTTDASGGGSLSVSDATTAPGVDAVRISASSQSNGDTVTATFSNFSITSDVEKRYVQVVADVNTFAAGAAGNMRLNDADGDYVSIDLANESGAESDDTVLANATGEGDVLQHQIGDLTVEGNGDGTLSEIQSVEVRLSDGDVELDIAALNTERMSEWQFGEERVDTDSDDDLETVTITEPHGRYSMHSLDSMGSVFDSATLHDLEFPATFSAQDLSSDDVSEQYNETDAYPGFDTLANIQYRISVPDAYDLSYSGLSLEQTTNWPGERYVTVEHAEGVGDTDFGDISSWSDQTSSFDAQDKDVTIDNTIQAGQEHALTFELKLTGDESDAMQQSGGAGMHGGQQGGGIIGWIVGLPGVVLSFVGGVLGVRRLQSSGS